MFSNSKELTSRIESLTKELNDSSLENSRLLKRVELQETTIESFAATKAELEKELADSKATIENLKSQHAVEMAVKDKSLNKKVNSTLASIGVTEFAVDNLVSTGQNLTDKEVLNKFLSLNGNEKSEFYKNNKDKITRALL